MTLQYIYIQYNYIYIQTTTVIINITVTSVHIHCFRSILAIETHDVCCIIHNMSYMWNPKGHIELFLLLFSNTYLYPTNVISSKVHGYYYEVIIVKMGNGDVYMVHQNEYY